MPKGTSNTTKASRKAKSRSGGVGSYSSLGGKASRASRNSLTIGGRKKKKKK